MRQNELDTLKEMAEQKAIERKYEKLEHHRKMILLNEVISNEGKVKLLEIIDKEIADLTT